ncbi:MAG: MarR family transcriptional regulator, partial [Actinomycetia bacterium]|nr:MarR family transcriptional regulator [Actinomycetes bacterium]
MILLNAQVAKDCGISEAALQTLHIISLRGRPMHPSELAEATALPRSTITRILDALEAAGFVTREAADDDKRRSLVAIRAERAAPVAARFDRYARAMARADDA